MSQLKKKYIVLLLFLSVASTSCSAEGSYGTFYSAPEQRLCIIIPAYNEEQRIGSTLENYYNHFKNHAKIKVILNGCSDNTKAVVEASVGYKAGNIDYLELDQAGKGLAIKHGFERALSECPGFDYIGFVDADGATAPQAFQALITQLHMPEIDGVIASRYMADSESTERPFIKKWGQRLCFLPIINCLFGLDYHDTQCGAKVFKRPLIEAVVDRMNQGGWSFDIELLYLAQNKGFRVVEQATHWEDQEGSHLNSCSDGLPMLCSLCIMRAGFCCR